MYYFKHNLPSRSVDNGIKFCMILSNKYGVDETFNAVICECLARRISISKAHFTPTGGGCIALKMYLQMITFKLYLNFILLYLQKNQTKT